MSRIALDTRNQQRVYMHFEVEHTGISHTSHRILHEIRSAYAVMRNQCVPLTPTLPARMLQALRAECDTPVQP